MSELRPYHEVFAELQSRAAQPEKGGEIVLPMSLALEFFEHVGRTMSRLSTLERRFNNCELLDESFNPNATDDGLVEIQEDYPIAETKKP